MFICFCLTAKSQPAIQDAGERIDGARYSLLRVAIETGGPFYPHVAEANAEADYRFFAGQLVGVRPSRQLPASHAVSRNSITDWGDAADDPDGSWIALKFDRDNDVLSLAADRWIAQRWYYHQHGDDWYVANSLRYLFRTVKGQCELNWEALPYLLQTEYLPLHFTPLRNVYQLGAGQVLTIRDGVGNITQRCSLPVHRRPDQMDADPARLVASVLTEAVRREVEGLDRVVIPLSGGTDSRFLLGCALEALPPEAITTFTFGHPRSLDLRIGKLVAQKTGVRHIPLESDCRPLSVTLGENFGTSEGMYSVLPDYPVQALRAAIDPGSHLLSGYLGDPVFGSKEKPEYFEQPVAGKTGELRGHYDSANLVPWSTVKPLLASNDPDPFHITAVLDDLPGRTLQERLDFWYFGPHTLNRTHFAVTPARDLAFYHSPMLQREVLEVAFSLPPAERRGRRAYFAALAQRFPLLHALPSTNNFGFPLGQPVGLQINFARAIRLAGSRLDELIGSRMGRILYRHPRVNYNHPRTCYLPQHREHVLICFEELCSVPAFSARGLQELQRRYRRNLPISMHLFRGLLTAHQWLIQYRASN